MSASTLSHLADYSGPGLLSRLMPLRTPWRSFRRRLLHRPGSTLALSAAVLAGVAILTNALALQTERHPSPMFTNLNEPRREMAVAADAVPMPPVRPQAERREASREAAVKGAQVQPAKASAKEEPQRTASIPSNPKDQLAAIIRDGSSENTQQEIAQDRMTRIQKALVKAGYGPLNTGGQFTAQTRAAIEKFEADRKLPVKGEARGKTLKELSRVSGMALN